MSKFKGLFWVIFTEHLAVQIFMYSAMFLVPTIVFWVNNYSLYDSFIYGLIMPVGMKSLSVISSAFKACMIIMGCNRGDCRFIGIYKEWTGKDY